MLNNSPETLYLIIFNKRGDDNKRRKLCRENNLDVDPRPAVSAPTTPVSVLKTQLIKLPLPASPEFIALKQSRDRRRSESLSDLKENAFAV